MSQAQAFVIDERVIERVVSHRPGVAVFFKISRAARQKIIIEGEIKIAYEIGSGPLQEVVQK